MTVHFSWDPLEIEYILIRIVRIVIFRALMASLEDIHTSAHYPGQYQFMVTVGLQKDEDSQSIPKNCPFTVRFYF